MLTGEFVAVRHNDMDRLSRIKPAGLHYRHRDSLSCGGKAYLTYLWRYGENIVIQNQIVMKLLLRVISRISPMLNLHLNSHQVNPHEPPYTATGLHAAYLKVIREQENPINANNSGIGKAKMVHARLATNVKESRFCT